MFRKSIVFSVLGAGLAVLLTAAPARGQTYDKLTYLTFSGPVQIPGVTLPIGTYRFRLTNPSTSRNVMQVLSHDGSAVYSMFHTIPDFRLTTTDEPAVTFKETRADAPPAVRSVFYGGESRGYEFVYGETEPFAFEALPAAEPVTPAPAEESLVAEAAPAPVASELVAEPIAPEPLPELVIPQSDVRELPKTASPLTTVGLMGVAAVLLGLGAGALRRRHS
jgi:hypothetical protein